LFVLGEKALIELLKEFVRCYHTSLRIIILGGVALQMHGWPDRITLDLDAEVRGDLESLITFLNHHHIPADLSENIFRWSIVAMPPGYVERSQIVYQDTNLTVGILSPVDLIVSKLRRGTDIDMEDCLFLQKRYFLSNEEIARAVDAAVKASVKDTLK